MAAQQGRERRRPAPAAIALLLAAALLSLHCPPAAALRLSWPNPFRPRPPPAARVDGKIKAIVLIVMENRSFDHMLGWLTRRNPAVDGLHGKEFNYVNVSDPSSAKVYVSDTAEFVDPDPGHSYQATREQIFGLVATANVTGLDPVPMSGFAQQAEAMIPGFSRRVMNAFRPEAVPVHAALATEFAVFDRWFAGFPGSTQPNRMFVWSATSHGATGNALPTLARGFPQRSLFDQLDDAGLSFGVYYQQVPSVSFLQSMRRLKHIGKFHQWSKFEADAKAGRLPNFSVLEPSYFDLKLCPANDDHPSHDVGEGQKLLKGVYEAMRASPQWEESLLIVTYDEHGGFHDHVPTPLDGVPSPDNITGPEPWLFEFDRLGVRVPTIMVSPWIEKGTVVHEPTNGPTPTSHYEASSVAATVRRLFGMKEGPLTKRDAWAATFEHIFDARDAPRTDCPTSLPVPKPLRATPANEDATLTEWQQELVQLAAQLGGLERRPLGAARSAVFEGGAETMSVREGAAFVAECMDRFLAAGKAAQLTGVDASELVTGGPGARTFGLGGWASLLGGMIRKEDDML